MNRWHVYEAMKRNPKLTISDLQRMFPRLSKQEIREGIEEFKAVTKEKVTV